MRTLVCIVGSDQTADDLARARELGRRVAEAGWVVVTGGRAAGVMEAACAGAKEIEGSVTVGILPNATAKPSAFVDIPIVTDLGNGRNNVNVLTGGATVACGANGAGTVSEIALAIKNHKPVILLACGATAEELFRAIGEVRVARTVDEAMAHLQELL